MKIKKLCSGGLTCKKQLFILFAISKLVFVTITIFWLNKSGDTPNTKLIASSSDDILSFEGFDNQHGASQNIVPNLVHLIYFKKSTLKFEEMINIFSIYFNHRPDLIYIHCDTCSFSGKYWDQLKSCTGLWNLIRINQIPETSTIFGVKFGWIQHRADIYRLLVLMNYGGIYLDNDVYVIKSLAKYFKYEMTVSWDSDKDGIGIQVIIAHRNARLLKAHYDSYR
jgi:hypothetical protein